MTRNPPSPMEHQRTQSRYARLLAWRARLGVLALVARIASDVLGWLPVLVPIEILPRGIGAGRRPSRC